MRELWVPDRWPPNTPQVQRYELWRLVAVQAGQSTGLHPAAPRLVTMCRLRDAGLVRFTRLPAVNRQTGAGALRGFAEVVTVTHAGRWVVAFSLYARRTARARGLWMTASPVASGLGEDRWPLVWRPRRWGDVRPWLLPAAVMERGVGYRDRCGLREVEECPETRESIAVITPIRSRRR